MEFLSLIGGCTGSSESTLVKISHSWKLHVTAQVYTKISGSSAASKIKFDVNVTQILTVYSAESRSPDIQPMTNSEQHIRPEIWQNQNLKNQKKKEKE